MERRQGSDEKVNMQKGSFNFEVAFSVYVWYNPYNKLIEIYGENDSDHEHSNDQTSIL